MLNILVFLESVAVLNICKQKIRYCITMKPHLILKTFTAILVHLSFWTIIYLFFTYFLGYGSTDTLYINRYAAFLMPITIATSYVFHFLLIPKYLLKNKLRLFILYSIYTFIISSFLIILSILHGYFILSGFHNETTTPVTKTILSIYLSIYFVVFIVISIGLIINNFKSVSKNEELKTKFLSAQLQLKEQELNFLKMQIHPHFLFNSLNTIYGYALQHKNEAPEMILKLSNLLDYILYQVNKPKVLLQNEINHLKDYISLEKLRFHDRLLINFTNNSQAKNFEIAPMLLIPFVENSFKHGAIVDEKLTVKINLDLKNDQLFFSVENSSSSKTKTANGIGLENLKKRLHLLYPEAHELVIENTNSIFKTKLNIEIKKLKPLENES